MPLVQGGPPEWIFERPTSPLKWTVTPRPDVGEKTFEMRLDCGMQVLKTQFVNEEELRQLIDAIGTATGLGKVPT